MSTYFLESGFKENILHEVNINSKNASLDFFECFIDELFENLNIRVLRVKSMPQDYKPSKLYEKLKHCFSLRYVMLRLNQDIGECFELIKSNPFVWQWKLSIGKEFLSQENLSKLQELIYTKNDNSIFIDYDTFLYEDNFKNMPFINSLYEAVPTSDW